MGLPCGSNLVGGALASSAACGRETSCSMCGRIHAAAAARSRTRPHAAVAGDDKMHGANGLSEGQGVGAGLAYHLHGDVGLVRGGAEHVPGCVDRGVDELRQQEHKTAEAAMVAEVLCNLTPRHPPSQLVENLPRYGS